MASKVKKVKPKTKKSAAKRFKITKNGKVLRKKSFLRKKLTHKSSKRKRNLRKMGIVDKTDVKRIKEMLPNG